MVQGLAKWSEWAMHLQVGCKRLECRGRHGVAVGEQAAHGQLGGVGGLVGGVVWGPRATVKC